MRRLAPMLGGDRRRIELAYSLQLSMPGTPVIRYGEEIGMGDNLDLPERDAIRTPMQWDSAAGAGFSRAEPGKDAGSLRSTRAAARRRVRLLASRPRPAGLVPPARPRFPLDSHGPPAGRLARPGQHGGGQRGGQCHRQGPDGSAPPLRRRSGPKPAPASSPGLVLPVRARRERGGLDQTGRAAGRGPARGHNHGDRRGRPAESRFVHGKHPHALVVYCKADG